MFISISLHKYEENFVQFLACNFSSKLFILARVVGSGDVAGYLSALFRLIESMMGLRPRQGSLRLVFRLFILMRGLPSIRLK